MANKTFADISDTTSVAPTDTTLIWNGSANKETTAADFIKSYGSTTELTSVDSANDKIPVIDDTDGDLKWVKPSNLGGGGDTTPYQIAVSVSANDLIVALKNKNGDDPSADAPVKIQIGGTVREITSALSVTAADGTNWCNAGSAELATKLIQYFVYLGYNATDGVTIGFSRIPYARVYSDFSTTSTNEKFCKISTITNAVAGDDYVNIGRISATLSAGAGYTWTISGDGDPVNYPIFETDILSWQPTYSASLSMTYTSVTTSVAEYRIVGRECRFELQAIGTIGGTVNLTVLATLPFEGRNAATQTAQTCWVVADTNAEVSFAYIDASTPDRIGCRRTASAAWVAGANKYINCNGRYVTA